MSSDKIRGLAEAEDFVQSLARGLSVLRVMGSDAAAKSGGEIASSSGLSRPVVRRLLLTLEALGYVAERNGRFFLTPKVMEFGFAFLSTLPLRSIAEPVLQRIGGELHESCSAAILDGTDIVYVARIPAKRIMSVALSVGTRLPAHCTSLGQVLLAHLPRLALDQYFAEATLDKKTPHTITSMRALRARLTLVKSRGYALVDQELEIGVRSVAAPIVGAGGVVCAAINVSGDAGRVSTREMVRGMVPLLTAGAEEIGRGLRMQD